MEGIDDIDKTNIAIVFNTKIKARIAINIVIAIIATTPKTKKNIVKKASHIAILIDNKAFGETSLKTKPQRRN
ncbi:MAG TPA: hypothetical protein VK152_09825 [Paludibacter sp.]|nr:hypothetical protein [Paludibacter sp.]